MLDQNIKDEVTCSVNNGIRKYVKSKPNDNEYFMIMRLGL